MDKKKNNQGLYIEACKHLGRLGVALYHARVYRILRGRWPNFINPKDLSERILSKMHTKKFLEYADLADKVKVHDYVRSKGLSDILLKHYGVWDNVDDININELPDKFILKPNNGSGGHVYCRNKDIFDLVAAKKYLKENLDRGCEYYFEPHYRRIKPLIFAEQLLDLGEGKVLTDYKFHCINGEIADVFLAGENEKGERKYATVDLDWNVLPYTKQDYLLTPIPPKPDSLNKMIECARILSKDFDFVRVDLYDYKGKVYFSELTFSPWGGLMYSYTDDAIKVLGEKFEK